MCDAEVLRLLRRRSLAALRQEVEPVTQAAYARFLPRWQGATGLGPAGAAGAQQLRGVEGVLRVVEQLAGARLPASAVESLVLPARVRDYSPALLDEAMTAGEVVWQGHGSLPGDDGWVSLHLAETADLTLAEPDEVEAEAARLVLELLERVPGGAYFFRALADAVGSTDDQALLATLWDLVWAGRVSADTFAPVRALLGGGRTAHRARRAPRAGRWSRSSVALASRPSRPATAVRPGPPGSVGRWSLLPAPETDTTVRALATAEQLLDRYGVLTRGSVVAEGVAGGYAGVYRVLAGAEEAGRVRRGYVVEGLGAAQFGTAGAIDRLRALEGDRDDPGREPEVLLLAATDPANPYGASVPWPDRTAAEGGGEDGRGGAGRGDDGPAHRPARKAGAMVVLVDGVVVLYVERGGRSALTFPVPGHLEEATTWAAVAATLVGVVRSGALAGLTVARIDGAGALGSGSPLAAALVDAGFHTAPQGLRLRR